MMKLDCRHGLSAVPALAAALIICCGGAQGGNTMTPSAGPPLFTTPWSDEFDGPANSLPDQTRWTYDLGNNNGWGNQELETYTNLPENVHLDGNGHLVIHVEKTGSGFTSARLKTKGLLAIQYGRVEARIKLPFGQGIWPAFWMLGNDIDTKQWPECGEIDIMENIGKEPRINHGSMHGPGYSGGAAITGAYTLQGGQTFADGFHTFAIQWAPQTVTFYVDDNQYRTVTPASLPAGARWVFDNPFFLLLNVAVGGSFPGSPDSTTQFPQDMMVDYIRYVPLAGLKGEMITASSPSRSAPPRASAGPRRPLGAETPAR
jgi:beta-glucanase (GH16 family)